MIVYKYLPPERSDFFKTLQMRFTQPDALNDPFECLPRISDTYDELLTRTIKKTKLKFVREGTSPDEQQSINKLLDGSQELAQTKYEENKTEYDLVIPHLLRSNASNSIGIFSTSKRSDSILMWSHYAKNHSGFVIGFQTAHDFFRGNNSLPPDIQKIQPVTYRDERGAASFIDEEIDPDFVFIKSINWKYEEEYRLVRPLERADKWINSNNDKHLIFLFSIPPECIKSVTFGFNSQPDFRIKIAELIRQNPALKHVKLYQTLVHSTEFKVTKQPY